MEYHHEVSLKQALDQLWLTGSTTIRWDEFYLWTGVQRITKKPWRIIQRMWEELCQSHGLPKAMALTVIGHPHLLVLRRELSREENVQRLEDLAE